MIRNRHKIGDYLMTDDMTGSVHYASEMRTQWNGLIVHHSRYEERHPQEFVRAGKDPFAVRDTRPVPDLAAPVNAIPYSVGVTNVPAPYGPAAHLYEPGIGEMKIGTTFRVK